jgi:N-acetylglucosamine-6-sulfatase
MGYRAVRTGRWKLIHYLELEGMDELYDLQADPFEMRNLIAEASAKEELQQLRTRLARLTDETTTR